MSDTDKQRAEGGLDKAKGALKEEVGELRGDDLQVAEGQQDQAKGGIKQKVADAKDKLSGLFHRAKK